MRFDLTHWPEFDVAAACRSLRPVALDEYPALVRYGRTGVHEALQGQGGLFLASDMARLLSLHEGMRVLDLGCGAGVTSVYLAEAFGVTVYAADELLPAVAAKRSSPNGSATRVVPLAADARHLPFSPGFFDAVFCMNAFFYFGTDDLYPSYLLRFLKPGGEIVIGSPCYRDELTGKTPEEFLLDFPACLAVHSPDWWRRHFEQTGEVDTLHCALHPKGAQFWEDRVHYLLEEQHPRDMPLWKRNMTHAMIRMLNRDREGFVSHFMLHARRRSAPRLRRNAL